MFADKNVFFVFYGERNSFCQLNSLVPTEHKGDFGAHGNEIHSVHLVPFRLVATNGDWTVSANNNGEFVTFIAFNRYTDILPNYECQFNYSHLNNSTNVIGLTVGSQENSNHVALAYLSKNHSTKAPGHLIIAYLRKNDDANGTCIKLNDLMVIPLHNTGERNGMVIAMDPSGTRAYAVADVTIISVDIPSKTIWSTTVPAVGGI